jgi:hypothetical protein
MPVSHDGRLVIVRTYGTLSRMNSALAVVEGLLLPWMSSLAQSDPVLGKRHRQLLRHSVSQFNLGTLALHASWMVSHPLPKAEWVFALGETHHQQFRTQAIGPRNRLGVIPVSFGVPTGHDAHPAPWHWDVVRLLTSVALSLPKSTPAMTKTMGQAVISDYIRVMRALANDDDQVERLDYLSLPEDIKRQIDGDVLAKTQQAWQKQFVRGKHLRLGPNLRADTVQGAVIAKRLGELLANKFTVSDVATRCGADELTTIGQQRWLVLCHERQPSDEMAIRLGQVIEGRPSRLAQVLPRHPFSLTAGVQPYVPNLSHDPLLRTFPVASGSLMAHTDSHVGNPVKLHALDQGDWLRLGRLWGQLLAMHHAQGLRTIGSPLSSVAHRLAQQASAFGQSVLELASEQTNWYQRVYRRYLTIP